MYMYSQYELTYACVFFDRNEQKHMREERFSFSLDEKTQTIYHKAYNIYLNFILFSINSLVCEVCDVN